MHNTDHCGLGTCEEPDGLLPGGPGVAWQPRAARQVTLQLRLARLHLLRGYKLPTAGLCTCRQSGHSKWRLTLQWCYSAWRKKG